MMYDKRRDVYMKSILITILLFAAVMCAIQFGVFDVLSNNYMYYVAVGFLLAVLIVAFKILGNPLKKDDRDEKK